MKKFLVHARTSLKLILLIAIAALLITCILIYIFRPIYSVTLNGEFIGYSQNKSKLQERINDYMENGDDEENVAFVEIDSLPEYQMCLLKKGIVTNDEEIFNKVKEQGIKYYEYYAITLGETEKYYVSTYDQAKEVVNQLKSKKSNNIDELGMVKKYSTELKEFTSIKRAVSKLYEEKPVEKTVTYSYTSTDAMSGSKTVNTTRTKVPLGISLIRPISGTITSRFGYRRSGLHSGLDIAAPTGTSIKAAASGTVKIAGRSSTGYGLYVVVSHGNGIETYYAHCSALLVKAGQKVSQGQVIARVGSTGNSTGPHLHLEIRINGACQNPQNYLY